MDREELRRRLGELSDQKYAAFQKKLIPGMEKELLGVRIPELRKLAKILAKEGEAALALTEGDTYEEVQLRGLLIGAIKTSKENRFALIREFVKEIDNWAVCDTFCSSLRFVKTCREETAEFLKPYLHSDREYEARFGAVMLLDYYMDLDQTRAQTAETLALLDQVKQPGYYARMAVAWGVSVCFAKFPAVTMEYLRENTLDDDTFHKALQKITESLRVSPGMKAEIRAMKRGRDTGND